MRTIGRCAIAAAVLMTAGLAAPTASAADPSAGQTYGQHVEHCAQSTGLNGEHNPGMHAGFSGWTGMQCEP